jgi:hypothetical protein
MNANIEMNVEMEMTNIMNDIGIKMVGNPSSKYYTMINPKTSRSSNYDIRFPFDWAINDIETENGCGPTACFACDQRCINDIFVHYCNKCLHKFVGKRGNPFTSDQIEEDEELWEKAPYMHGVRLSDIGQEEQEEEEQEQEQEQEDYTPFQSAEHMRKYDEATRIQEEEDQDQEDQDQDQEDQDQDQIQDQLHGFIIEEPQSVIEHIPYPKMFV